jgi:3-oxoadipate enol-lactonase
MPYVSTALGRLYFDGPAAPAAALPPVVFLHGLFLDRTLWQAQAAKLSETHAVYNFDLPGHGLSDVPPPFTLDAQADAFAAALSALRLRQVSLAGLSWGGMLAMRVAVRFPELVARLALFSTIATPPPLAMRTFMRAGAKVMERVGIMPQVFDLRIAGLMYSASFRHRAQGAVAVSKARVLRMDKAAMARAASAVGAADSPVMHRLGQVRVPTMVVCGELDTLTPMRCSERIAAAIPGAVLHRLPGVGHLSAEEAPQETHRLLAGFLRT